MKLPVCIPHSAPPVSGSAHLILVACQALLPKIDVTDEHMINFL